MTAPALATPRSAPALDCPGCAAPWTGPACSCGRRLDRRGDVWVAVPPEYEPPGFPRARQAHLAELEERHFWFAPRERLVARVLARLAPGGARAAVELGCGSGRMLATLARVADAVVGVDGHAASLDAAVARGTGATLVHADVTRTPLAAGQFDLVVALDVLEHVDPAAFLGEARRLARPGARLLLAVPAFDLLWSEADAIAGHRCRYTLARLRGELAAHGWTPLGHAYYQALLFPLMVLSRRVAPRRLRGAERRPPAWAGRLLGAVSALEVTLSARLPMPFGSSLVAWARS